MTKALLRFLTAILGKRIQKHVEISYRRDAVRREVSVDGIASERRQLFEELPSSTTTVIAKAARRDAVGAVLRELDGLDQLDREIIIMRVFEQRENQEVASSLGITPGHAAVRYHRALARLKERCAHSMFSEM